MEKNKADLYKLQNVHKFETSPAILVEGYATDNTFQKDRLYLLEKQGGKCIYCEKKLQAHTQEVHDFASLDHIVPRSKGGSNAIDNLCVACHRCNKEKNSLPLNEYLIISLLNKNEFTGFSMEDVYEMGLITYDEWFLLEIQKVWGNGFTKSKQKWKDLLEQKV